MILIRRLIGGRQQYFRDGKAEHRRAPFAVLRSMTGSNLLGCWTGKRLHVTVFWKGEACPWCVETREARLLVAVPLEKKKGPSSSFEGRMRCWL
jgi:hypothetical protein